MQYNFFFKFSKYSLLSLVLLSLLTPIWVFKDLLFPFITSKAFYLRILVELGLPFFAYILVASPKARPSLKSPINIAILAFLVINVISAFTGIDWQKAIWGNFERMGGVFYLLHLILLYFYIVTLAKIDQGFFKKIIVSNILVASLIALYGILLKLGMPGLVPDPSLPLRVSATFGNPIFFASYLLPIIFLSIFWGLRKKAGVRFWFFFLAFIQLIGVFLSGTRGATVGIILGCFVSGLIGILLMPKGKAKAWSSGIVLGFLLLAGIVYFNADKLPEGSMIRRVAQLNDSNTQARLIQWKLALTGFKDYPILGTGAENYYVVGNKYFNPEIYKYDPSWFDKPHNYILEVLVTNGFLGFLAYLSILLFCALGFYKAWKYGALSLGEFVAILSALLAYQIQNLFVFDTVSASMSFFIFLSLGGFLWEQILNPFEQKNKKQQKEQMQSLLSPGFSYAVFAVMSVLSVYLIWTANVLGLRASKDTNYGYAYASVDPVKAEEYFQNAINSPYNFDKSETSHKYQEFATMFLRGVTAENKELVERVVNNSIEDLKLVISQNPYNPISWQKLAMLYLNFNFAKGQPLGQESFDAVEKAIELAPKRTEARLLLMQMKMISGNFSEAILDGNEIVKDNPKNLDALWQLSLAYKDAGNANKAIEISENLFNLKYQFPSIESLSWLFEYYVSIKNWQQAIMIQEKIIAFDPENYDRYVILVELYSMSGQEKKATELAQLILKTNPNMKSKLEKYLP